MRAPIRMGRVFLLLSLIAYAVPTHGQRPDLIWQPEERIPQARPGARPWIQPQRYHAFRVNHAALRGMLARAGKELPHERRRPETEITLPMPDGSLARFLIIESPVMEPELAAKFPEIRTYRGVGVDDPQASVRLDLTPQGFHAQILSPRGAVYIDPYWRGDNVLHTSYYKRDYRREVIDWICLARGTDSAGAESGSADIGPLASGNMLRTYRLACAATGEYTQFHGGTVAAGLAAVVTAINRVTGVYEVELAIRLVLVANNDQIIYTNPATDPYNNNNGSQMLSQNQSNLDTVIGSANYDIGHVFSTGGGGVAYLGVVCVAGSKAGGVTGSANPTGDAFWIDYVAHEMGHQFGANHTFNSTTGSCGGGNRNASTAYEPGSGSTIMAYAGICGSDDLQPHSDPYFHSISYEEIMAYVAGSGGCSVNSSTGNTAPNPPGNGGNFTIPANTPFVLTASGSDPDGDALTYCWEERDLGPATTVTAPDNGSSPLFRSFNPTNSPARTFPRIEDILGNTNSIGEKLPTTSRTMKFKVTVRDNRLNGGGVNSSATNAITVVSNAGPFQVTFPNTATNLTGAITVTWNVANTSLPPINASNVNIRLSTDGGRTFPTVLAANTPNDGNQTVTLPNLFTSSARIKVEAAGNIFFDISNANFTILPQAPLIVSDGATLTAESCLPGNGAADPGETVTYNFALRNIGTVSTTNLVATLLAVGGVSAPSAAQNYGALPAGGAGVGRSFSFTATGFCGSNVVAVLALQDGAANLGAVTNLITLGALGPATTNLYSSGGLSTPIPDLGTVEVPISVTDTGVVADVNVRVRLNHTFDGDLIIDLVHPDNTVVNLANRRGGSGNNYGSGANSCSGTFTVFDDAAATPISAGSAPFAGAFRPEQPLTNLNGKPVTGTWKLRVTDAASADTGTIGCWQLQIARQQRVCCFSPPPNQPPAVTNAFISPATPCTTNHLTVLAFAADPDNDPVSFSYQWQESLTNLAGQTAAVLPAAATFAGGSYRCLVTPSDGKTNGPVFATAAVLVPVDFDGNGLNDDWEVAQFGHIGVDANADPDGDGFSNAQEFAAGTDPNNAASALRITAIERIGSDIRVSFDSVAGRSYRLEWSDNPDGSSPATVADVTATSSVTQVTHTNGASVSVRFYRVKLLQP